MPTTYRKPKFTPDPPLADVGDLSGLTTDEKLDRFIQWTKNKLDWTQREVYRIEDWWPNDYANRLEILESLVGCISEPITMLGAGTIDALNYRTVLSLQCGDTTELTYDTTQSPGTDVAFNITYSPNTSEVIYTLDRAGSQTSARTIYRVDESDTVRIVTDKDVFGPSLVYSSSGLGLNDKFMFSWFGFGGFNSVWVFDVTDFNTTTNQYDNPIGPNDYITILAEAASYIYMDENTGSNPVIFTKSSGAFTQLTIPSGWDGQENAVARRGTGFIVALKNTSTNDFSFFSQSGTGNIVIGDKLVDIDTDIVNMSGLGLIDGSKIFWPVNFNDGAGDQYAAVLVTDLDGTEITIVDATFGAFWATAASPVRFSPEDTGGYIWWAVNNDIYRMNTDTYAIESCTTTPGRAGTAFTSAAFQKNEFVYMVDPSDIFGNRYLAKVEALV